MTTRPHLAAFTLIELSIVLVIIGLLIGGVLAGRELIKTAELRSVVNQVHSLDLAAKVFKSKYNCLPGDCANATKFWGQWSDCGNTGTFDGTTCDGGGNGRIDENPNEEVTGYWQHLGLSALLPGRFSGWWSTIPYAPATELRDVVVLPWVEFPTDDGWDYIFSYYLMKYSMEHDALSPFEAQFIDSKLDDGLPFQGSARVYQTIHDGDPDSIVCGNAATRRYAIAAYGDQRVCRELVIRKEP
jgi:prepilin-type N-terminal cleavage/methylation domain-containing protein